MNHRAKAARYDDERWTMMSWMKHNKLAKTISASVLAVGICFGTTAVASATCQYPVSGGSYSEGTYHVEWSVQPKSSYVKTYTDYHDQYCYAQQDSSQNYQRVYVGKGRTCTASVKGNSTDTRYDYVEYYQYS
jgi:hypothetical protein